MRSSTVSFPEARSRNFVRVFVVGCPRSGTTLLQSLLAANSHVASFPESHFYEKLFPGNRFLAILGIASRRAGPRWFQFLSEIDRPDFSRLLPRAAVFVRQYSEAFIQALDILASDQGKFTWIEKTPGHLRFIDRMENLVERARFIHVLRPGPDNIASLYEVGSRYPELWGDGYRTLDQCVQRWVEDIQLSRDCLGRPTHRLVNYSELVEAPRQALLELCDFIGVPFESNMLTHYMTVAEHLILKQETWKSSVLEPIRNADESKFYKILNGEQRDFVLSHIPEDLLKFAFSSTEQQKSHADISHH